jgi:hypothetical protein
VTLSTPSLAFNGIGQAGTFTATSSNVGATLSAKSDNTNVATVVPGASGNFTVNSLNAGTANITVTDTTGGSATLVVTVTTFSVTVN